MNIKTLADLSSALTTWVKSYETEKAKWLERLDRDPVSAMVWSTSMFQEAPRYWIAKGFIKDITDRAASIEAGEEVIEEKTALINIRDIALTRVLDRSRRVASSSSTPSNLTEQYETAAWADLLNLFGRVTLNG